MYLDTMTYLPDDILTKVDRATMASSLEGPHALSRPRRGRTGLAASPRPEGARRARGKWLLRRLLHRYVPPALVERPKAGFGIPDRRLAAGPAAALGRGPPRRPPTPDRRAPRRAAWCAGMWDEHLSGRRDRQFELWDVLMFQAWLAQRPASGDRALGPGPGTGAGRAPPRRPERADAATAAG